MYASSCTSTVYSSTPMIRPNIGNTYVKYCGVFGKTWIVCQSRYSKCEWHQGSVEFLGYMLSADGLTMSIDKVQTIQDCPSLGKSKTFNLSSALSYGLRQQSWSETGRGPKDKEVDRGVRPRFRSGGAGLQLIGCALYYVPPRYLEV
jgi:hypothetical protein